MIVHGRVRDDLEKENVNEERQQNEDQKWNEDTTTKWISKMKWRATTNITNTSSEVLPKQSNIAGRF